MTGPIYILHHDKDATLAADLAKELDTRGLAAHHGEALQPGDERYALWQSAIGGGAYCVVVWSSAASGSAKFQKLLSNLLHARIDKSFGPQRPSGELGIHPLLHADEDDPPPKFSLLAAYVWDDAKRGLAAVAEGIRKRLSPQTDAETAGARVQTYLERIRHRSATLPIGGFSRNVRIPLDVERTYVPLRAWRHEALSEAKMVRVGTGRSLPNEVREVDVAIDEAIHRAATRRGRRGVAVLGGPGSGKTTLLKHLVLLLTDPAAGPARLGLPAGTLPLLLPLRYAPRAAEGLGAAVEGALSHLAFDEPGPLAAALAQASPLLLLVDGLDELATQEAREAVSAWIARLADARPDVFFVVTSRYSGWKGDARLDGRFEELHVRDLQRPEVEHFVRRWFAEVEQQLDPEHPAEAEAKARQEAAQLLDECLYRTAQPDADPGGASAAQARVRTLHQLAGNPLLLHVICLVHKDGQRLPEERVELLKVCAEVLLEGWRRVKGVRGGFTAKEALELIQPVAWAIQTQPNDTAEVHLADIAPLFGAALERLGRPRGDVQDWLCRLRDEAGVLVELGEERYGFLHLSFQEYLAACHAQSSLSTDGARVGVLAGAFGDERWKEVVLLGCGLTQPDLFEPLMRHVLASGKAGRHPDWLDACLLDAAVRPMAPFWEALGGAALDADTRYHALRVLRSEQRAGRLQLSDQQRQQARAWRAAAQDAAIGDLLDELLGETRRGGELRPGDEWTNPVDGSVLVYVPAGEYPMGAGDLSEECRPVHAVWLDGFWIGRYPVTNAQWSMFRAAVRDAPKPLLAGDKNFGAPDQPVVGVSFHDVNAYCRWAGLALPSEAQWEAAARGPEGRAYPWGDEAPTPEHANFANTVGHPTAVGRYALGRGPFGTFDQAGNVWEWCADVWVPDAYRRRPPGARNPVELRGDEDVRALRGGSWFIPALVLRAATRYWFRARDRVRDIGFRVVRVLPPA